jgi:hypothetical protein
MSAYRVEWFQRDQRIIEMLKEDRPLREIGQLVGLSLRKLRRHIEGRDFRAIQSEQRCALCGEPVPVKRTGRPREFCSTRCRVAHHRRNETRIDVTKLQNVSSEPEQGAPAAVDHLTIPSDKTAQAADPVHSPEAISTSSTFVRAYADELAKVPPGEMPDLPPWLRRERTPETDAACERHVEANRKKAPA